MSVSSEASMHLRPRPRPGKLREGARGLHARPDNGAYQDVLPGQFGESVPLPEPFAGEIATGGFPVYGGSPCGPQSEEGSFTERSK
jgi:hypothetical protein